MTAGTVGTAGATTLYDEVASASAAAVIRGYSTSFGWACRLLGPSVRGRVRDVYALVRVADECVDDMAVPLTVRERAALLDALEADVAAALVRGRSANLVVHAFARTARRYGIGADLVDPFFEAMRADLTRRVHDAESLARYVHGSAEVVGLMCLRVFVDGDEGAYRRLAPGAARLGAAFQKVNFLRDLADDHDERGRVYFPGLDLERFDDAERDRLLDDVDADLAAAAAVVGHLPRSSRVAVQAAHDLFADLSRRLRATPARELRTRRVRVPDPVKLLLVARGLVHELGIGAGLRPGRERVGGVRP